MANELEKPVENNEENTEGKNELTAAQLEARIKQLES